jgi:polyferredoxin
MRSVKTFIIACFLLFLQSGAVASEGHRAAAAAEFHLEGVHIKLQLDPDTFRKDQVTRITATLTDQMSGGAVTDAELYIKFEKRGQTPGHAGHSIPRSSGELRAGDEGLSFGEATATPVSLDLTSFTKLSSGQTAGVFSAAYTFPEKGEYTYTLAVIALGGRKFPAPLTYGSSILYDAPSNAPFYRMLFAIGFIVISGLGAVWLISQRRAANTEAGQRLNILDIPWIKKFVKSTWFQPVFQIPTFLVFLIIIAAGLFDVQQGDRNVATLLMWTIWWAAIIFTFVLVGRVWCMMCPFGALQDWLGGLVSMNRDFPRPLRNTYLSSVIFFGLTWWDSYSGIVNKPALTAYLLLGFFAVAAGMAVIYKGRSFCRYVCPIGGLIGIYSMFSPVELRNKCMEVCRDHKVKECIKGTDKTRGCPMFVTPMTLDRNNYCNLCSECIKSCSQDNIVIRFRSFAKDLWVSARGYMDEAYLAMVVLGVSVVVTGEMVEPWHKWMDVVGKLIPFQPLGLSSHAEAEKITFLVVMTAGSLLAPMLLLLAAALIVRKLAGTESPSLKETVVRFAYMFIPVGLSMHLAHNISHLFKEGPAIVPAVERALNEYAGFMSRPEWDITPLMGAEAVFWLQVLILITLNLFSLYAGYRIADRFYGERALKAFIPMATLAVFFMVVNAYILGQPMALRHTH